MRSIASAADPIRVGQLEIHYKQEANGTCQIGCFELRVPPGSNVPPPHSHTANEELVVVLDGVLRFTVGEETRDLQVGESMSTPPGVVHGFSNPHATMARALVINTPDVGAAYFREMSAIIGAGGPPDKAKMMATMQRYGLKPALPSAAPAT